MHRKMINISTVMAGQRLGLKEALWDFCRHGAQYIFGQSARNPWSSAFSATVPVSYVEVRDLFATVTVGTTPLPLAIGGSGEA
jgi:hypothetical protein